MTREKALRAAALEMLRELAALDAKHARYVAALRELHPDISGVTPLPCTVEERIVRLIDTIFDADDIAAYLRWNAGDIRGGGLIEVDGRSYTIRTVADVAAYLEAEYPLGAEQ